MEIHAITTGEQEPSEVIARVKKIIKYVDYVHIRERRWTARKHIDTITTLKEAGISLDKIIINDRVDIADVMHCSGVHLATHSIDIATVKQYFPLLNTGCSVHSVQEARHREKYGVDYLFYGHIFPTKHKAHIPPRGLKQLEKVTDAVSTPVIAIGGITPERIGEVKRAGASGVAIMSGIFKAKDVRLAARAYYKYK